MKGNIFANELLLRDQYYHVKHDVNTQQIKPTFNTHNYDCIYRVRITSNSLTPFAVAAILVSSVFCKIGRIYQKQLKPTRMLVPVSHSRYIKCDDMHVYLSCHERSVSFRYVNWRYFFTYLRYLYTDRFPRG